MNPVSGDLVILVRPKDHPEQPYRNQWSGPRIAVLDTHRAVVNAITKALAGGHERVFLQTSPGGRIFGSTAIGEIRSRGEAFSVEFVEWHAMDEAPAGRSWGHAFYWVG